MSRKETKQQTIDRLLAESKAQRDLNAQLANVLKMIEDGQWVVISEKDLNRYRNGIDVLIKAGDALNEHLCEFDPTEAGFEVRQLWAKARASDKF